MSKQEMQLDIPKGADAAICFIHDQYYLRYLKDGVQQGKFLSPSTVRQAFSEVPVRSGWLPEGVRQWGTGNRGDWMLAYHEPQIYKVLIDARPKVKTLRVPMPALVWFGIGHNYYIWAMKGEKFDPKAEIFHAPLANINGVGLICFGKNAHPTVEKNGFEKTWQTFWEAPFNEDHSHGKSRSVHSGSINQMLVDLHKAKATVYPQKDLIAIEKLETAIERLTVRD